LQPTHPSKPIKPTQQYIHPFPSDLHPSLPTWGTG
jgi:hypothetical protein